MPDLANTTLETSPSLDICQGFAIIPTLGTLRASVQGSNVQRQLIDVNFGGTFSPVDCMANVNWSYFLGICGPAWAMNTEVSGSYDSPNPGVQLSWGGKYGDGSQDGFAGGIQAGLEFAINWKYNIKIVFVPRIEGNGEFRVSLLKIFLDFLISRAGSGGSTARGSSSPRPSPQTSMDFDLFITRNGEWKSNGTISFTPGIEATMNILDVLSLIPVLAWIRTFKNLIERVGGSIVAGPVLQAGFPITIAPEKVLIGTQSYNNLRFEGGKTVGDRNAAEDNAGNDASNLTLTIKQSSQIDVKAGIELNFAAGKFFSIGNKWTWSILDLLSSFTGINLSQQSDYRNNLAGTIGTVNRGFASLDGCGCGPATTAQPRRKVVFAGGVS
ncbi:MAG: hypothetical protein N2318_04915 [Meiothermus sp.]|nr:hypothetical protein [Meiothermus sp.]